MVNFLELPGAQRIAWYHYAGSAPGIFLVGGYALNPLNTPLTSVALELCRQRDIDFSFLEFRGQGESSGKLHQLTLPAMIEDIQLVFQVLPRAPRIGIGTSLGGWALLAAAQKLPLESLLLLSPAVDWDTEFVQPQLDLGHATQSEIGTIVLAGGNVVLTQDFIHTASCARIVRGGGKLPAIIRILHGHYDDIVTLQRMTKLVEELSGQCDVSLRVLPDDNHQLTKLRSPNSQRVFLEEVGIMLQDTTSKSSNSSAARAAPDAAVARPHLVLSLFGRCGSLFLHSLFDGHSQLSTIPGIAPYNLLSWFVREGHATKDRVKLVEQVTQRFTATFNDPFLRQDAGLDRLGEQANETLNLSAVDFHRHLLTRLPQTDRLGIAELSAAIHDAFDLSFGREPRQHVFLELHTIVPGDSAAILAGLPDSRTLFLVRDPLENIESCVNYLLSRRPVQRNRLSKFYQLILGMLAFQAGQPFLNRQSLAVRFEDVKREPEQYLSRLCEQIGLSFEPSLLESTYMGKRYHSAPTQRNPGITGFQQTRQAPSGYRLTEHDRRFFSTLFAGISDYMGYTATPRASVEEVDAVLTRLALDVEVAFAQEIGLEISTLGNQQDLVNFRQQVASLFAPTGSAPCGLHSTRLALVNA